MTPNLNGDETDAWTPTLRLTHCRGRERHGALPVEARGQGLAHAIALEDRPLDSRQARHRERCRIEPDDFVPGQWRLANDSPDLTCTLNGSRVRPGQAVPIAPGDELEVGLLRFLIEATGPEPAATVEEEGPSSIDSTRAAPVASAASTEALLFDLRDLAHPSPASSAHLDRGAIPRLEASFDILGSRLIDGVARARPTPPVAGHPLDAPANTRMNDEDVMRVLHFEYERAVRSPSELRTRSDWNEAAISTGPPAPSFDQLVTSGADFHLLRDVLLPRADIDEVIDDIDSLGATGTLQALHDEEVLSLFAPDLATSDARRAPDLTRREHHAVSLDSPVQIGRVAPREADE